LCEPLETTANGKRLVVEDSAACQKTIQSPVAQQVLKTDGAGNLTWTNGANSTILGKDSTGKVEFAIAKEQLGQTVDIVAKGMMRLGMHTRQLSSLEVLDLFYSFYNPSQAKLQPLTDRAMQMIHTALVKKGDKNENN
jgi:hypothetical protein